MKAKHLFNSSLPLTQQTYDELRKGLQFKLLKWSNFPQVLKNAYHNFNETERITDFEKQLHKKNSSEYDNDTVI